MSRSPALLSCRDVARLFGLTESRVRYWAQTGLVNPTGSHAGRRMYTFRDLVAVRAVTELLDQGVPLQRVRRNLAALRQALPEMDAPLSQLRVRSDGERLVVEHHGGTFEPESGQMMLDFGLGELDSKAAQILELRNQGQAEAAGESPAEEPAAGSIRTAEPPPSAGDRTPQTAYGWFLRGCMLDGDPERSQGAIEAYRRAIDLDPGLAAAYTNLGNLYYRGGQRERALRLYEQACALEPDQPEAHYNLGNLLDEEGDAEAAAVQYSRALALDNDFRDAHFNLALCLERLERPLEAVGHWQRYLHLAQRDGVDADEEQWRSTAERHLSELLSEVAPGREDGPTG